MQENDERLAVALVHAGQLWQEYNRVRRAGTFVSVAHSVAAALGVYLVMAHWSWSSLDSWGWWLLVMGVTGIPIYGLFRWRILPRWQKVLQMVPEDYHQKVERYSPVLGTLGLYGWSAASLLGLLLLVLSKVD